MRFGIIGTGAIAPINTRALMACPEVEIVAVANRTVTKAEAMCHDLGLTCPIYSDWREMLDTEKPDVAVINLYNDLHKECFLYCAQAGIHILVEKPLSNTYEECLEMMEAAKAHGVKAAVLHTQRYGEALQTARAYIDSHRQQLGRLISVNDRMSCNYFWDGRNPWHLDPVRSGGGIVMNYGVHQLDRIHWLMDGQQTVRFHGNYVTAKPGIGTVSSYTMLGVTGEGTAYTATCNGYTAPFINEVDLVFVEGVVRCILTSNGQAEPGVYVCVDKASAFQKIDFVCENGDGGHLMYVREMTEALDYLPGRRDTAPITLEWAAEMVRLCNLGFAED